MLSREDNNLLTQVGPGTPIGVTTDSAFVRDAMEAAVRVAAEFAHGRINEKIEAELDQTASQVAAK